MYEVLIERFRGDDTVNFQRYVTFERPIQCIQDFIESIFSSNSMKSGPFKRINTQVDTTYANVAEPIKIVSSFYAIGGYEKVFNIYICF